MFGNMRKKFMNTKEDYGNKFKSNSFLTKPANSNVVFSNHLFLQDPLEMKKFKSRGTKKSLRSRENNTSPI